MTRRRNKPQTNGKMEASETMLNEREASETSDIEFKPIVIMKISDLTENYQNLQGNYKELIANYINIERER